MDAETPLVVVERVPHRVTVAPSGLEIAYFTEPRGYELRHPERQDWLPVPSVTEVLQVLPKDALSWWGMRVGFEAVLALWEKGFIRQSTDERLAILVNAEWQYMNRANLEAVVLQNQLDVNNTKSDAGNRGQLAHDAFELYLVSGQIPNADLINETTGLPVYQEEERMYVKALQSFCEELDGCFELDGMEVAVGSLKHRFAGRYDVRLKITKTVTLDSRAIRKDGKAPLKRGRKTETWEEGQLVSWDLKTTKGIYASHVIQQSAYEEASIENGYAPTDRRAIIHASPLGVYQLREVPHMFEAFLAARDLFHALKDVEAAL